MEDRAVQAQAAAAPKVVQDALETAEIVGVYLYGSAVEGGLRPDSDLDILVVTDRSLEPAEKARIVDGLLPISGRETRPPGWRPLEVTVVAQAEVRPWRYPPRMELQYGEWLRSAFLAGQIEPGPVVNPDLGVLVMMVRRRGQALMGPSAKDVLDAPPHADVVRSTVDGIPALLEDLRDDTRNALLTLARIWMTVATGEIHSKDAAADWAIGQLSEARRAMLVQARDLYRNGGYGEWRDSDAVRELAEEIVRGIDRSLARHAT